MNEIKHFNANRANVIPIMDKRVRDVMLMLQDDWQFLEIKSTHEAAEQAVREALGNQHKRSNWAIIEEVVNTLAASQLSPKAPFEIPEDSQFFKAIVTIRIGEHVKTYRIGGPGEDIAGFAEHLAVSYLNEYDPKGELSEKLYWSVSASTSGVIDP